MLVSVMAAYRLHLAIRSDDGAEWEKLPALVQHHLCEVKAVA
jgi:hypothetical protein